MRCAGCDRAVNIARVKDVNLFVLRGDCQKLAIRGPRRRRDATFRQLKLEQEVASRNVPEASCGIPSVLRKGEEQVFRDRVMLEFDHAIHLRVCGMLGTFSLCRDNARMM